MNLLDKLERKIGWFAIPNFTLYLVAGNALVWAIGFAFSGGAFVNRLVLYPSEVFKGEVWRLLTFLLTNTYGSMSIFALLELYFLYMVGRNLEASWGYFRFTVFYFIGYALTVIISLASGFPVSGARYIHLTLFFAFARLAPEMRILLFFIIPVKIKWMAWAAWAFTAYEFIMSNSMVQRLFILAPIAAYLLFFWRDILYTIQYNRGSVVNRRKFARGNSAAKIKKAAFHKCEVCGLTELDAQDMDFRYCSKCAGSHEFCMNHLDDHHHFSS